MTEIDKRDTAIESIRWLCNEEGDGSSPEMVLEQVQAVSPIVVHPRRTLRDWFAGQALAGLVVTADETSAGADLTAGAAYEYADAMLKARDV